MSLQAELNEMMAEFSAELSEQEMALILDGINELADNNVTINAKKEGENAPSFSLMNVYGDAIELSEVLERGHVVLSFYRGSWCPLCNLEINALQKILPEIKALGAQLITISPEKPDSSLEYVKEALLDFEVLSDTGNKVANAYGLQVDVFKPLRKAYLEWELDVPSYNDTDSWGIPIPATYIINRNGKIARAFVDVDYSKRMEPAEILAVLKGL